MGLGKVRINNRQLSKYYQEIGKHTLALKPSLEMRLLGFLTLFILTWSLEVQSWESWSPEEMDIFDLVEEVLESKQNFYEYMELTQEATTAEIRKAYRKLSLVLHPDKNDAEDAEIKFRWLAGIYEVLKDKEKRDIYDRVLVEGLPDWRSPAFFSGGCEKLVWSKHFFIYLSLLQSFNILYTRHIIGKKNSR